MLLSLTPFEIGLFYFKERFSLMMLNEGRLISQCGFYLETIQNSE